MGKKTKIVLLSVLGIVALRALLGPPEPRLEPPPVAAEASVEAPAPAEPEPEPPPDLELLEFSGKAAAYGGKIVGKVRNNSGRRYSYVQVVFTLLNEAGEQTGSAMANVNGLEPGRVWAFEAAALSDFSHMKLDKITGF